MEAAGIAVLYSISLPFPLAAGQIFPDLPTGVLLILVFTILLRIDSKTYRDILSPNIFSPTPEVLKKYSKIKIFLFLYVELQSEA